MILREYSRAYTPFEVSRILKIDLAEVYTRLHKGLLPSLIIDGKFRIPKEELDDYIESLEENGPFEI